MGTAVGTKVYVSYGWRAAALVSIAWIAFEIAILLIRGPHCSRKTWFGYEGGVQIWRDLGQESGKENDVPLEIAVNWKTTSLTPECEADAALGEKGVEGRTGERLGETRDREVLLVLQPEHTFIEV